MRALVHPARWALAALVAAGLTLALVAPAGAGSAAERGCASFSSQAAAQAYLLKQGGAPKRSSRRLDPDRDGVACEGRPGPYRGFAAFGYNERRGFFYGTASMPPDADADGYACMYGNSRYPEGSRRLHLYRVRKGSDRDLLGEFGIGVETRPATGRLRWKLERPPPAPGRYYVVFEESIPLSPYGPVPCPGFRSRAISLGASAVK